MNPTVLFAIFSFNHLHPFQDVLTDISQQWWVSTTRLELRKPFYQLRISPVLPQDSGEYRCRLETDPLFTMDVTAATVSLIVMGGFD